MNHPPLSIHAIEQIDNYTFSITWNDQFVSNYNLNLLQQNCPCAQCQVNPKPIIDKDVRATKINGIGRYALKIHYTSGCSLGIYTYALLRTLSKEHKTQ